MSVATSRPEAPIGPGHVSAATRAQWRRNGRLGLPHHIATVLQRQPTRTSCGPTTVAMLAGVPVVSVLAQLTTVRLTARRQRVRTERTNVGEMRRLLASHGLRMGHRVHYWRGRRAVLRVDHVLGRGWHWAALEATYVFDPCLASPVHICDYARALRLTETDLEARLSFYPVEAAR